MIKAPEVPEELSKEIMEALKPMPRCFHGHIVSLCIVCNMAAKD
jgi:hypothetical protein